MGRIALLVVLLLSLMTLYTIGIAHGAPRPEYSPSTEEQGWLNPQTIHHPDEFAYVGISYRMLLKKQWDPKYYHNPALTIYTNMFMFAAGDATDLLHDADFSVREIAPFQLYFVARYLSALHTMLMAAFVFAAGRAFFDWRAGVIAAAVVGFSPLVTQHAHYATPNAQATMLMTAALFAAARILKGESRLPLWVVYAVGGLLVGLTMAARYNAVVVGLVVGLAMLTGWWQHRKWLLVVIGGVMMPVGLVLGFPPIVLVTSKVIDQVRGILEWYRVQGGGAGFTTTWGLSALYYHWRYLVLIALGPVSTLAAILGIVRGVRQGWRSPRWRETWIVVVLIVFVLVYTCLALLGKRIQNNLLFPLVVALGLLAGYGTAWLKKQHLGLVIGAGLVAWPALLSILFVVRVATPDTREKAQEWIYTHVPRDSKVYLLGPYNVPLDPLDYRVRQTYGQEATPEKVRDSNAQIIVYSDAVPFLTLRDTALSKPQTIQTERGIQRVLADDWIELARFERVPWPAENLAPDDVSYWHQVEIVIYCNPDDCPVSNF